MCENCPGHIIKWTAYFDTIYFWPAKPDWSSKLADWPPWYSFQLLQWFIAINTSCTRTGTPLVIKLQRKQTNSYLTEWTDECWGTFPAFTFTVSACAIGRHEYMIAAEYFDKINNGYQICSLLKHVKGIERRSAFIIMNIRNRIPFLG